MESGDTRGPTRFASILSPRNKDLQERDLAERPAAGAAPDGLASVDKVDPAALDDVKVVA
jgi:hypothetical protein